MGSYGEAATLEWAVWWAVSSPCGGAERGVVKARLNDRILSFEVLRKKTRVSSIVEERVRLVIRSRFVDFFILFGHRATSHNFFIPANNF